ncbi:MAG: DUF547 domain-containing protein [Bacteroidetes bacterium]|nr:DUF547 domain-containing protein [Bacteroidota bacterium]MBU1679043.1 DUF547 domain-containing protein [Bacteroidota bacterium]MBU2506621.1 DUF547 domain-containing protein [Bacteroidota bacterium]
MRTLLSIAIAIIITGNSFSQNHELFTDILKQHVKDGLVDYNNLRVDKRLDDYLLRLTNSYPEKMTHEKSLAFWINTYNAFTLKVVADNYPINSITELHTGGKIIGYLIGKTVWDKEFITVNKKKYSLNDIEHKILRKLGEPRIHFAIVCASISCPILLNEAYEEAKLEKQLEDQTKIFLSDHLRNYFDLKNRTAHLSKIFDWFAEDFGSSDEQVLKFISNYLPKNIADDVLNNITNWDISYKDYNWNLNKIELERK